MTPLAEPLLQICQDLVQIFPRLRDAVDEDQFGPYFGCSTDFVFKAAGLARIFGNDIAGAALAEHGHIQLLGKRPLHTDDV
jgi:hypothetical protein